MFLEADVHTETSETSTLTKWYNDNFIGEEQIDLVKVDVEGAELCVLKGISDKLWTKIRQVVVETDQSHKRDIEKLFLAKGFTRVKSEQSNSCPTHIIYAVK